MALQLLPEDQRAPCWLANASCFRPGRKMPPTSTPVGDTMFRNGKVSGRKVCVPMAAGADAFLVTVPGGVALVEHDGPGVSLEIRDTQDGGNIGMLILDNAPASVFEGDATEEWSTPSLPPPPICWV